MRKLRIIFNETGKVVEKDITSSNLDYEKGGDFDFKEVNQRRPKGRIIRVNDKINNSDDGIVRETSDSKDNTENSNVNTDIAKPRAKIVKNGDKTINDIIKNSFIPNKPVDDNTDNSEDHNNHNENTITKDDIDKEIDNYMKNNTKNNNQDAKEIF